MKFLIFWKLRVMHDIMITPVLWQLNCLCVINLSIVICTCILSSWNIGCFWFTVHAISSPSYILVTFLKRDCMYDQLWFHVRWLYQLVYTFMMIHNNFYDDCIYICIYIYLQSDYTFRIKIKFQDTVQSEHPCKS